jgi:hypothetical protein
LSLREWHPAQDVSKIAAVCVKRETCARRAAKAHCSGSVGSLNALNHGQILCNLHTTFLISEPQVLDFWFTSNLLNTPTPSVTPPCLFPCCRYKHSAGCKDNNIQASPPYHNHHPGFPSTPEPAKPLLPCLAFLTLWQSSFKYTVYPTLLSYPMPPPSSSVSSPLHSRLSSQPPSASQSEGHLWPP